MGIPGFYLWITSRENRVAVAQVVEDQPEYINGVAEPVDTTKPNPNGVEFDNLYLDMNGIIHPCFHPDELVYTPADYEEVFIRVFHYIDRIFSMIRPRKLLFLAIDGVAPRAKMNQQRARRFKAIKEAADAMEMHRGTAKKSVCEGLDSNVITPGTEFMELLSSALQYYIHLRMNEDPGWEGVKVILSDASVPGEGEQKIMSYIRLQRNLPGYNPNTRHCFYGMDADLIMLALATHEIHFSILREVQVRKGGSKGGKNKKRKRHKVGRTYRISFDEFLSRQRFEFLHMWILRECLAKKLEIPDPSVEVDLERLIDDFVFMCLFIGNDFLPHVPSLDISKGDIDLLISVYKEEFVRMGGYLTDSSEVNLDGLAHFLHIIGSHEDAIFKERLASRRKKKMQRDPRFVEDNVNLGEDGWKERYYNEKFKAKSDADQEAVKKHAVIKYVEGICWVMRYYYQGVCSWQWFYPYHYAPFASDFHGVDQLKIEFVLGEPFKPFNQLMAVLPAASAHALPRHYRNLMTNSLSPILDFYPTEFERDLNGKKQPWKAVCRLPFVEEGRLLAEIARVEHTLTDAERQRNTFGVDKLFIHMSHALATKIFTFFERNKDNPRLHKINPESSDGMNGYLYISDKPICPADVPSPIRFLKPIMTNKIVLLFYQYPEFHPHIPRPPEGVIMHQKPVGCPKVVRPTLYDAKTAIGQTGLTKRQSPYMTAKEQAIKYQKNRKLVQEAELKKKSNPTCLACNIGYPLVRMRRDVLKAYLNHTCLGQKLEDKGDVGKMTDDAPKYKNSKTGEVGKMSDDAPKYKNSKTGEVGKMTDDAPKNKNSKTGEIGKMTDDAPKYKNSKTGEVGKMTDDAPKYKNSKRNEKRALKVKKWKMELARRKLKRSALNRKLRKATLASNDEEGEVRKKTDEAQKDNTTNADDVQKDNTAKTDDAQKDNITKTERNRRRRKRYILNKKLRKASLASNGEEEGKVGETIHNALNAELRSSGQGVLQNMINGIQNDNKGKGKLNSACFAGKSEIQVEVRKLTSDAVNDNNKKKRKSHNSKREDHVVGKMDHDTLNNNSKKTERNRRKRMRKILNRKLKIASLLGNGEAQVEVGKMRLSSIITDNTTKVDNTSLAGKNEEQGENSTIKLDNSCLVNRSQEQGEAGKITTCAVNDNSKKKKRGKKKRKLDSACSVAGGVHHVEVGKTTHHGPKENSTVKLDNSSLVNKSEEQGEAGKMANDAVNDKSQKKRKLDSDCLVTSGVHQVEVGKTTHDGPKENSTIKLDISCLVNKTEEQGEAGNMTNVSVNNKNRKKRRRDNKKGTLNSTCLVAAGADQVEVGKTSHDAPKENSTVKLNSSLVNKSEEQGVAGKMANVVVNDKSQKKMSSQGKRKKRKLDGACLVANGVDQVEVGKTTQDAPKGNSTVKLDNFRLANRGEEQREAGKMINDAVNDKSQRGNKKSESDSACLVTSGINQVVGKTTHDAPKDNSTAKLTNSSLVNKSEEQGKAGKRRRGNKKRILDGASLVPNGEDKVNVPNGENQVEVGRTHDDTARQGFGELWNLLQAAMTQTRGLQAEI